MPRIALSRLRSRLSCFATLVALLTIFTPFDGPLHGQDQRPGAPPSPGQSAAPFQVKVASDLVIVRVVVRDAQGKPVEGLQKEDFKLFDRGKDQTIAQFEAGPSGPEAQPIDSSALPGTAPAALSAPPNRLLVLYFDDLDMTDADVIYARDAADHYLSTGLQPNERVAIFTSSTTLSDFTADPKQIHEALLRLHPHPRAAAHSDCPDLADYQAKEIVEHDNPNMSDAWRVALDEAVHRCHMPDPANPPPGMKSEDIEQLLESQIRSLARMVMDQSQIQARTSLQSLEQVVHYISGMPGQRSIILVSPGFLSQSEQYQLDRIIDRALRAQVVIDSLDPRGLALLIREADASNGYMPAAGSGVAGPQHAIDTNREMIATDVLAEVAEGTGGEYFHDNNDLTAGFRALVGSEGSYTLAFAPTEIKQDGKFHSLKVTLSEKHSGLHLQARRGYFAPKEGQETEARLSEAEAQPKTPGDPATQTEALTTEALTKERIREAVISKTDVNQLPVVVQTEVAKDSSGASDVSVLAHLDTKTLHFHKAGDRNQNTVTFVSVIFDHSGKYVNGQQRQARVDLPDALLPNLQANGMDIKIIFPLSHGTYTVREVVTDAEDQAMTTLSRSVEVQ